MTFFKIFFLLECTVLHCATENELIDGETIVMKTGRTTGSTTGLFFYKSIAFRTKNNPDDPHYVRFSNCYGIKDNNDEQPFFKLGDSGSGIYLDHNEKILGIGIAIAKNPDDDRDITFVSKIQGIVEAFNIDAYTAHQ